MKVVCKDLGSDLMMIPLAGGKGGPGLWLGANKATLASLRTQLTDGVNQTTTLALSVCYDSEQQLNRHSILTGINM